MYDILCLEFRFQFSILLFIVTTVPPIWILELTKLGRWGNQLNVTATNVTTTESDNVFDKDLASFFYGKEMLYFWSAGFWRCYHRKLEH